MNKKLVLICWLITNNTLTNHCERKSREVITFISPRSQSVNLALQYVGWQQFIDQGPQPTFIRAFRLGKLRRAGPATVITVAPVASTSFRPEQIAQSLFGETILDCSQIFRVTGSQTERRVGDWLADYFGLPTDYESAVQINPHTHTLLVDTNAYIDLSCLYPELFAIIRLPVAHTRWDVSACEKIKNLGTNPADAGYFSNNSIPRDKLVERFTHFMNGTATVTAEGLIFEPLQAAQIACHAQSATAIADVRWWLGYRFLHTDCYHLDISLVGAIPTGTRPQGIFLFEPVLGNGHHTELGIGMTGHYIIDDNETKEHTISIHGGFTLTHLFATNQCRFFDLKNKTLSRYMLAAQYTPAISNNLAAQAGSSFITPNAQYNYHVAPVANLTRGTVSVSSAQLNFTVMLSYRHKCTDFILGYEFWGRSTEKLCNLRNTRLQTEQYWALKGDAHVVGFAQNTNAPVALSATESLAQLTRGTNTGSTGVTTPSTIATSKTNPAIDHPFAASGGSPIAPLMTTPGGTDRINTSLQPILLKPEDIDIASGQSRGMSNSVYAHINHTWYSCPAVSIGIGAQIEFGDLAGKNEPNKEKPVLNAALSQWIVWIKGGVEFD